MNSVRRFRARACRRRRSSAGRSPLPPVTRVSSGRCPDRARVDDGPSSLVGDGEIREVVPRGWSACPMTTTEMFGSACMIVSTRSSSRRDRAGSPRSFGKASGVEFDDVHADRDRHGGIDHHVVDHFDVRELTVRQRESAETILRRLRRALARRSSRSPYRRSRRGAAAFRPDSSDIRVT